ncbi:CopG family transcriptional regulator [Chlorogloeopsis sp. ULAP01]|uniref:CopG family transcriptional regulator n=1 Tax=Chlorogloeopsis sp. ULAP01 TaxID=3056483 RepID=UPI0025AAC52C|nr:CopG family transcriptional regulator [Chlorogloeopsis sp. ULAP01]MDM9385151.1 CopG family transcriptional regulator [Chlorogloeopsis sp. ULAP01]
MNKTTAHKSPSATTPYQLTCKEISVDLTQDEANHLENYCRQTGKAATDVIQELIQSLPVT